MGDFDFWAKEWPVIAGAPHLVIGGGIALVIAAAIIIRWIYSREISALRAQLATKDERLEHARDRLKDLDAKLTEAQTKSSEATRGPPEEIFHDINIALGELGTTLGVSGGRYQVVVPHGPVPITIRDIPRMK